MRDCAGVPELCNDAAAGRMDGIRDTSPSADLLLRPEAWCIGPAESFRANRGSFGDDQSSRSTLRVILRLQWCRYLKRPLRISWESFQWSFGAGYAETPQGKSRFRGNAIEALLRVKAVYPQLRIEIQSAGVLIQPSMTHVPKTSTS